MKMIGISRPARASVSWTSSPLAPGNRRSRTTQAGRSGRARAMNSREEANTSTSRPTERRSRSRPRRTDSSSSMTNTIGAVATEFSGPRAGGPLRGGCGPNRWALAPAMAISLSPIVGADRAGPSGSPADPSIRPARRECHGRVQRMPDLEAQNNRVKPYIRPPGPRSWAIATFGQGGRAKVQFHARRPLCSCTACVVPGGNGTPTRSPGGGPMLEQASAGTQLMHAIGCAEPLRESPMSDEERERLHQRARQQARLLTESRERQARLEQLLDACHELARTHARAEILLPRVAEQSARLLAADAVGVLLLEGERLALRGTSGPAAALFEETGSPVVQRGLAAAVKASEAVVLPDVPGGRAVVALPLRAGWRVTGVLAIARP